MDTTFLARYTEPKVFLVAFPEQSENWSIEVSK